MLPYLRMNLSRAILIHESGRTRRTSSAPDICVGNFPHQVSCPGRPNLSWCEFWGFHGGDIWSRGLLVVMPCSVVVGYQQFRGPYCEDGSRTDLWNVGILPQHYTASQTRITGIFAAVNTSNFAMCRDAENLGKETGLALLVYRIPIVLAEETLWKITQTLGGSRAIPSVFITQILSSVCWC